MNTLWIWIQFAACLGLIILAGSRLAKYADLFGERAGLSKVWIGVIALATVTSLPELATGISSVTIIGQPDLTFGDIFGANLINLLVIAVIDILYRKGHLLPLLGSGVVLTAALGVTITAAAAVFIFLAQDNIDLTVFGHVSLYSFLLLGLYILAQLMIFRYKPPVGENAVDLRPAPPAPSISTSRIVAYFLGAALATVIGGIWLGFIGNQIVEITGLSSSLVGTLFLAVSTTAPEIVVSISAVRLFALDMAVGNLVGSVLFNIGVIIFIDDIFYRAGSILQHVDPIHVLTALFAILMSTIVIIGILFKPRLWLKPWAGLDVVLLAAVYIGAMLSLFFLAKPA
ncbi:cation:H+ antiporter [Dehalogenimonas formicexedens]|uniref:Cation:H+ antiporter n=1 Tax=Dehalogenimonas formicexedens TaxID=1839801 RepID=A0A1P8F962_9CHLR|nr:hypothetical protein [Dehalogenimonas formicexedens]APV44980.1 cation:H+ antiporter [Dehalogenimonas formicexedens]